MTVHHSTSLSHHWSPGPTGGSVTSSTFLGGATSWLVLAEAGGDVAVLLGAPLPPPLPRRPLPLRPVPCSCPTSAFSRPPSLPACALAVSSPVAERDVAELVRDVLLDFLSADWAAAIGSAQSAFAKVGNPPSMGSNPLVGLWSLRVDEDVLVDCWPMPVWRSFPCPDQGAGAGPEDLPLRVDDVHGLVVPRVFDS
jgi:hypothetical protein